MEIFINEASLQEQYFSDTDFAKAVVTFTAIFDLINQCVKSAQMYKSELFLDYKAIRGEVFQSSYQKIKDKQLKVAFRRYVFDRLNPRDWQPERKHSRDDWFEVNEQLVTDTSIAELAERKLRDTALIGLLVNFIQSEFAGNTSLLVSKNRQATVKVDCVENRNSLEKWLALNLSIYTTDLAYPPRDEQTVLQDMTRFRRTSRIEQGRKVYQEKATGYYWYVDQLHFGRDAHLEVFDAHGRHLGEANLNGEIDYSCQDPQKHLPLA
ncbi:MAG TPA: hypothetical protein PKH77_12130 [Anaerolineae bacterium]|nr:hypothetical protein [Anaerolineae bacterium]